MMNDTVREELQTKPVSGPLAAPANDFINLALPATKPAATPVTAIASVQSQMSPLKQDNFIPSSSAATAPKIAPAPIKFNTSDLTIKKTSPTLVAFETKNAQMPDWRLQLQNSVRQRSNGIPRNEPAAETSNVVYQKQLVTNGANALKTEYIEEPQPVVHANSKVAAALKRIEDSRRTFLPEEKKPAGAAVKVAAKSNYPFNVVSRSAATVNRAETKASVYTPAKPKLVSSLRIEKKPFDTNKLPPLPKAAKMATSFDALYEEPPQFLPDGELNRLQVTETPVENEVIEIDEVEMDEFDDLAPLAMRFNAGLFDLIIGGFASSILMSPFLMTGGSWMSLSGALAFAAGMAIVMFVYLTASIGYTGRTFGMRLFSLELVDAELNEYPTLHQAAVSSAVYLLSLAFAGIGLLPIFFNEEKRAAHDLVSGTILIREL